MIYKTVNIKPDGVKWKVSFYCDGVERLNKKTFPNPIGFYHYKNHIPDRHAFEELKDLLITKHEEEIFGLTLSLNALRDLKYEI
jgi:hypothetical protein